MTRLLVLLSLSLALAGCDPHTLDRALTVLEKGSDAGPDTVAFAMVTPEPELASSSEDPTPAPDCTPTLWRAMWTNPCSGETWPMD